MGCGQSQFSLIYPKKFKRKDNKNKDGKEDESDEENDDDKLVGGRLISNKSIPNLVAAADKEESNLDNSKLPINSSSEVSSGTSLLAHREMTSSQIEFFRMLDEKVESGPDYDETNEKERLLECARLRHLLTEWERAKQKRMTRQQTMANQTVQTSTSSQQPRKHRFSMPHLNGDVNNKQYQYPPVCTIRQHVQYYPNSPTNQYTLSNSVVMYDQVRGQYYTELA
ncbi:uncharacterized protein LOC135831351 [Planococcus citri]|uniref:uncharacterized protein LOC135831351 n=1 Tax=Planococcus citri TaxID=170843 RepID=UPI0031F96372